MKYALGNMLNGAGGLNADQLALDLQFAADKTLTARKGPTPVLTRGSTGTFVGSNGLIQSAAINSARFDHDPVSPFACRGLLMEEGRTNLLQRSEEFSNTYWAPTRAPQPTANAAVSPDGATTADKLIADTTPSSNHRIDIPGIPLALSTVYTLSIYAKASEYTGIALGVGASLTRGVDYSLVGAGTATPVSGAGHTGTIQQLANGWYRCTATFTSDATTANHRVAIYVGQNGTTFTYTGDNTSGIFIWGAQLEAGSFATSYIPTTTSALARSADVCNITGGDFTNLWNNNQGTIFASGDPRVATTAVGTYLMANSGSNANQVSIYRTATINTYGVANSGSYTANISASSANGSFNKIAGSYITNDARAAFNNVLGTPDTSVIVPTNLTRLNIGSSGAANQEFANGCISAVRYYKKSLSNQKLQTLTA